MSSCERNVLLPYEKVRRQLSVLALFLLLPDKDSRNCIIISYAIYKILLIYHFSCLLFLCTPSVLLPFYSINKYTTMNRKFVLAYFQDPYLEVVPNKTKPEKESSVVGETENR